jgi:uracil-DNA glycosylase family 4
MADAAMTEAEVFITNSVACLPHPVRPSVRALAACRQRLTGDIEMHPRSVIVALGVTAVRAVTGQRDFRMMENHGKVLESRWAPVVPALHPARVLRRRSERPLLVADLELARELAGVRPAGDG